MRNKFKRGFDQFIKINDYWEYVIGAREYSPAGTCSCIDDPFYSNNGEVIYNNVTQEECDEIWSDAQFYNCQFNLAGVYINYEDHDGFLTVESQKDWDGVPSQYKYPMQGSNHLTVKNDANTKWMIDTTLGGEGVPFFGY